MNDEQIIQECYSGKIDKKKLLKLGGTVGFTDILYAAIKLAREDEEVKVNGKWYLILEKRVGQILFFIGFKKYGQVNMEWRHRR